LGAGLAEVAEGGELLAGRAGYTEPVLLADAAFEVLVDHHTLKGQAVALEFQARDGDFGDQQLAVCDELNTIQEPTWKSWCNRALGCRMVAGQVPKTGIPVYTAIQEHAQEETDMSERITPNVAEDLLCIHAIITRGLNVSIEKGRLFAQGGYPDASTREGFIAYAGSLVSVLHAHHLTESDLFFPYLRDKLPDAPFDLLITQHRDLEPVLQQAKAATDEASAEARAGAALDRLNSLLGQIDEFWHPHIRIEEDHLSVGRAATLIPAKEHERLARAAGKHGQQHSGPDYLVVPFLLHNLPPDRRPLFARFMPPVVTRLLVPIVWKRKWAPMRPFLLP